MGPNNTERQPLLPRDGTAGSSMPLLEDEEEQQQGLGLLGRRRSSVRRRRGRQELGVKAEVLDEPLPERVVWAYAFGHVLNDASAACWFSYLLIYLEKVRRLTAMHAGVVMFSGQILDAMATPIAGLLADATPGWPDRGLGGRMLWYLVGSALAVASFLGVFAFSPFQHAKDSLACVVYFAFFASTFNVGWAAVQVTNLSFIPELAKEDSERVRLVKLRYAATIMANLSVFLLYLHGGNDIDATTSSESKDVAKFQGIAAAVLAVGSLCSLLFVVVLAKHTAAAHAREQGLMGGVSSGSLVATESSSENGSSNSGGNGGQRGGAGGYDSLLAATEGQEEGEAAATAYETLSALMPGGGLRHHDSVLTPSIKSGWDWFRVPDFYWCAVVYMGSRIVVNISQVYLQFYLIDTLGLGDKELALVPLTLYVAGLAATFATEQLNGRLGRKLTYWAGGVVVLLASIGFHFLTPERAVLVYPLAVILGIGSTTVMITSHSMSNDLVGEHAAAKGGFVYGAFSLTDKLANGVLILLIQGQKEHLCPAAAEEADNTVAPPTCALLIRRVLVWLPALSTLVSAAVTFLISSSPQSLMGSTKAHVRRDSPTRFYRYSSFRDPCDEEGWTDWVI